MNKDQNKDENFPGGSGISDPEEKELRKYDDWHAHKHEKDRDLKAEFREGELHGVVGKEIHDALKKDQTQKNIPSGSNLTFEELEQRKYDDWHAHKHEKDRDLKAEFREGELHGVVGKEIYDAVLKDKEMNRQKSPQKSSSAQTKKAPENIEGQTQSSSGNASMKNVS